MIEPLSLKEHVAGCDQALLLQVDLAARTDHVCKLIVLKPGRLQD
jgi:hypothetical protein